MVIQVLQGEGVTRRAVGRLAVDDVLQAHHHLYGRENNEPSPEVFFPEFFVHFVVVWSPVVVGGGAVMYSWTRCLRFCSHSKS